MNQENKQNKLGMIGATGLLLIAFFIAGRATGKSHDTRLDSALLICVTDSDSVKRDIHADVISFDHRLYQKGVFIGTYDKKTAMIKGQVTTIIQIYDTEKTPVAEARANGVNPSAMSVTIFSSDEKMTIDVVFTQEAESLAKKLSELGEL